MVFFKISLVVLDISHLTVSKMAADRVCHLGYLKNEFLTDIMIQRVSVRHLAKFRQILQLFDF